MQFNPDVTKQAIQVIFSQKRDKPIHPPIYFNESEVVIRQEQKHFGMILDSSLNFQSHARETIVSARRGIGVIRYMSDHILIMRISFTISMTLNSIWTLPRNLRPLNTLLHLL